MNPSSSNDRHRQTPPAGQQAQPAQQLRPVPPSPPQSQPGQHTTVPHPATAAQANQAQQPRPQVVYLSRPLEPHEPHITEEVRQRHEASKEKYPGLNLSDGEYIINAIERHPIGLFNIWGAVILLVVLLLAFIPFYALNKELFAPFFLSSAESMPSAAVIFLFTLPLLALFALGGFIATKVYRGNKFFLTNESVIQVIRTSIFSTKEQTISLANIEDASYRRHGILQTVLNYGSLRLSTEGDETTYRYNFVSNPRKQVAILNNAVESFKNGRPVEPADD